jgi:hypothetical protein
MSDASAELTPVQQAAYMAWAEEIERDDWEPHPRGNGVALEGDEAADYTRTLLGELDGPAAG